MTFAENIKKWLDKWQSAILPASVMLNVFLIGFMVARIGGPQPIAPPQPPAPIELRTLPEGLSSEVRERIEDQVRRHQDAINTAYARLKELQEEINEMVSGNDFNAAELEHALNEMRHLESQIKGPLQRAFVDVMRNIDRENRRVIVRERREEMRARSRQSARQPGKVDGSRWSFSTNDGHFQLDMEELKGLEILEGLRSLEELSDLENFEITITRNKDDDGKEEMRFIIIDNENAEGQADTEVIIEDEIVTEGEEN
ncbi:MAG: periplasmic heavy metal sensor [Sphingomonadales bacterium]|nr:periplasmic heavy metal sensor [Sphingomonadales bacterium]